MATTQPAVKSAQPWPDADHRPDRQSRFILHTLCSRPTAPPRNFPTPSTSPYPSADKHPSRSGRASRRPEAQWW